MNKIKFGAFAGLVFASVAWLVPPVAEGAGERGVVVYNRQASDELRVPMEIRCSGEGRRAIPYGAYWTCEEWADLYFPTLSSGSFGRWGTKLCNLGISALGSGKYLVVEVKSKNRGDPIGIHFRCRHDWVSS